MTFPKLLWSPFLYLPALVALVVVEPIWSMVAGLTAFALWAGLRAEA